MTPPTVIPFNIIDEGYSHGDDPVEPLTVHIEVRAVESLDDARLDAAVLAALALHPLARARMAPWIDDETGYRWFVDAEPQINPFRSIAATASELDDVRAEFYSRPLSLFESPPLCVQHVAVEGGDVIMLSVHHAAADGMGSLRLLRSICRAYAGLDDPQPDLGPAEARALVVPTDPPSWSEQIHSSQMEMQRLARLGSLPARLAPVEQTSHSGYGFKTASVALGPILDSPLRQELGASVNDVLIAAASLAAGRWNLEHGADASRVVVLMPMNARPAEWNRDVVANLVVADSVSTNSVERRESRNVGHSRIG